MNGATKTTRKRGRTRLRTTARATSARTTATNDGHNPAPPQSAGQNEDPKGETWQLDSAIEWVFANKTLW